MFHLFFTFLKKRAKNFTLNISVFFVDDGLFISQEKTCEKSNALLFCSYSIITFLFDQFSFTIEHGKSKVFHFSKSMRTFNPSPLDLSLLKGLLL